MNCSTSCRKRIGNTAISIITFALGLGLIGSSHAQTAQSYRSKADQKKVHMTQTTATQRNGAPGVNKDAIRPFRVNIPKKSLIDLRGRIEATRWPDKETVDDRSQGAQLAKLQELVQSSADWIDCRRRLF
jgi:hypothetical protein